MDTNMININCVTFEVTFEAQFMKKSTNTGVELKKSVAYKKKLEIPLYKKLDLLKKENYKPVCLLPHVSKAFKRILYKQIMSYMNDLLSNYITGFRKLHGSRHCLLKMLEKWKNWSWWISQKLLILLTKISYG